MERSVEEPPNVSELDIKDDFVEAHFSDGGALLGYSGAGGSAARATFA